MGLTDATCSVFDVQRFSIHDGPGIRTTVFLQGCAMRCAWCQNPEAFGHSHARTLSPQAVIDEVARDAVYYAMSGGGLTVSGGEPLLHLAPVRGLLQEAKGRGLHTCVQTAGAVPEAHLAGVLDLVDLFQFDLKHMDSDRHRELTGVGTERIHANAGFLLRRGAPVHFRMPLIPGINDDGENLSAVAHFLAAHRTADLHIVPYHRLYLDKYRALGQLPRLVAPEPPTDEAIQRIVNQFQWRGVAVTIDG